MNNIIACIGEPKNTDSICNISAWVAKQTSLPVSLLHVASPHYEAADVVSDLSGQIGLGSRSDLLEKLTKIDEDHGKLEQKKGQILLDHAVEDLTKQNIEPEIIHRRGSLAHTVAELESDAELFVMGKYGKTSPSSNHLGHNLESVAQTIHKPLLVVTRGAKPIKRFLIAYDGCLNSNKAVNYAISHPLLKGVECHLIKVGEANDETKASLSEVEEKLKDAGFKVCTQIVQDKSVENAVTQYITDNAIDLLVMGAYGHSKIRTLLFGSITTSLLKKTNVPVLLFK